MTQTTVPVIFDLDGTLVDPAGGITGGIAAALEASGLPVPEPELLAAMIGCIVIAMKTKPEEK